MEGKMPKHIVNKKSSENQKPALRRLKESSGNDLSTFPEQRQNSIAWNFEYSDNKVVTQDALDHNGNNFEHANEFRPKRPEKVTFMDLNGDQNAKSFAFYLQPLAESYEKSDSNDDKGDKKLARPLDLPKVNGFSKLDSLFSTPKNDPKHFNKMLKSSKHSFLVEPKMVDPPNSVNQKSSLDFGYIAMNADQVFDSVKVIHFIEGHATTKFPLLSRVFSYLAKVLIYLPVTEKDCNFDKFEQDIIQKFFLKKHPNLAPDL